MHIRTCNFAVVISKVTAINFFSLQQSQCWDVTQAAAASGRALRCLRTLRCFAAGGEARNSPSFSTANGCRNSFQRRPRGQTSSGVRLRLAGQSNNLDICASYCSNGCCKLRGLVGQSASAAHSKTADLADMHAKVRALWATQIISLQSMEADLGAVPSPSATIRPLAAGTGKPTHSRTLCSTYAPRGAGGGGAAAAGALAAASAAGGEAAGPSDALVIRDISAAYRPDNSLSAAGTPVPPVVPLHLSRMMSVAAACTAMATGLQTRYWHVPAIARVMKHGSTRQPGNLERANR